MEQNINGTKITGRPVDDATIKDALMDDVFWLERGKDWVKSGFENINNRSAKIQEAVAWFFGVSSLGTLATSIGIHDLNKSWLGWMILPMLSFLVAYGLQVFAQTSVYKTQTYFESPTLIEKTYFTIVSNARALIRWGANLTFFGFICVPVILFLAITNPQPDPGTTISTTKEPYILCKPIIIGTDSLVSKVLIVGRSGLLLQSQITIELKNKTNNLSEVLYSEPHFADSTGSINISATVAKRISASAGSELITKLEVKIDDTTTKSLTRKEPITY